MSHWSHAYLAHAGNAERRKMVSDAVITNNKIIDAIKA